MAVSKVPLTVVLDTNFIAVPAQFNVDIFSEAERLLERRIEFVVLSTALDELERKLSSPSSRTEERHFRIAKELVKRCTVIGPEDIPPLDAVDDQVLEYAQRVKGILATNDRELRKRARKAGVPVLMLRGRKQLALDGGVV
jgi:rRNA-processing protein FCF1